MEVLLLRHGKTDMNQNGRYQGRKTDIPLCAEGIEELRCGGTLPKITRVYVSPLLRARQTAEICFPNAEQIVVPDFSEMDFGSFEGKTWKEMEHDPDYQAWLETLCRGKCPGGESMGEFVDRTAAAFLRVLEMEAGKERIVIAAHGGTVMALLSRYGVPERDYYDWSVKNGEGYLGKISWNAAGGIPELTEPLRFQSLSELAEDYQI